MIELSQKDKEYIENNKGSYYARGLVAVFDVIEKKFGKEKKEEFKEEVKMLGYDVSNEGKNQGIIPLQSFITVIVAQKQFFNLSRQEEKEMGRDAAKISFLVRFASKLFVSLDVICENANNGWHKYYSTGELVVTELNKDQKRIVGEIRDFNGHPSHCIFVEGYLEQIICFVTGKKVSCEEEECLFRGGNLHRYILTWE